MPSPETSLPWLNCWTRFEASVEGVLVNGVDIISWNAASTITAFKVMGRPLKGVNKLHEVMGRLLARG